MKEGILPRIHICAYILGKTKRQFSGSQNSTHWTLQAARLFEGERDEAALIKGMDAMDAAIAKGMLAHVRRGREAMHGSAWPDVEALIPKAPAGAASFGPVPPLRLLLISYQD